VHALYNIAVHAVYRIISDLVRYANVSSKAQHEQSNSMQSLRSLCLQPEHLHIFTVSE